MGDYGGGYGGAGGGYSYAGGFSTDMGSTSPAKPARGGTSQRIFAMTIAQLRSMTADASGQSFVLPMPAGSLEPSVPVHQAHLMGRILGIKDNETTCDITISDTTGSLMLSHSFSPDDADWANTRAQLQVHSYAELFVNIRINSSQELTVYSQVVRPVLDKNAVTAHALQCVYLFCVFSKGRLAKPGSSSQPTGGAAAMGGAAYGGMGGAAYGGGDYGGYSYGAHGHAGGALGGGALGGGSAVASEQAQLQAFLTEQMNSGAGAIPLDVMRQWGTSRGIPAATLDTCIHNLETDGIIYDAGDGTFGFLAS